MARTDETGDGDAPLVVTGTVVAQGDRSAGSDLTVEVGLGPTAGSDPTPPDPVRTTTDDRGGFEVTVPPVEGQQARLVIAVHDDGSRVGRTILEDPPNEVAVRVPIDEATQDVGGKRTLPAVATVAAGILSGCANAIFGGDEEEGTPTAEEPGPTTPRETPTPTPEPTDTPVPTGTPGDTPPEDPTETPTAEPAETPTAEPAETPTAEPTETPTVEPAETPTATPTETGAPESDESTDSDGTTDGDGGSAATEPSTPGGLSAQPQEDYVELSWNEVDGADAYNVYWATSEDVSPDTGTRIGNVTPSAAHTAVQTGTTYYYVVTATNSAGESGASGVAEASVPEAPTLEPPDDPDLTTQTSVSDQASVLYEGDDAIQTGVEDGAIDDDRVSILSGSVKTRNPRPLGNVTVRAPNQPEVGSTRTRSDGAFDIAVNGGSTVILRFERSGFLPIQRQVPLEANDQREIEPVALIGEGEGTTVELDSNEGQIAQGEPVSDEDGERQATVFVPPNTSAMDPDDGTAQSALEVRATEYTVGENGPQAMPDELPNRVGYTYAVELSAEGTDGSSGGGSGNTAFIDPDGRGSVEFDQPVIEYEYNFLDFPVGSRVPIGFYDDEAASWQGTEDGRVIEILGVSNGQASIDVDGSGQPADQGQLDDLGVTDAELSTLADRYDPGDRLWRTPIPHFSPWDCNWNAGPPLDAVPPIPDFEIKEPPGGPIDPESTPDEPPDTPEGESPEEEEDDDPCDE